MSQFDKQTGSEALGYLRSCVLGSASSLESMLKREFFTTDRAIVWLGSPSDKLDGSRPGSFIGPSVDTSLIRLVKEALVAEFPEAGADHWEIIRAFRDEDPKLAEQMREEKTTSEIYHCIGAWKDPRSGLSAGFLLMRSHPDDKRAALEIIRRGWIAQRAFHEFLGDDDREELECQLLAYAESRARLEDSGASGLFEPEYYQDLKRVAQFYRYIGALAVRFATPSIVVGVGQMMPPARDGFLEKLFSQHVHPAGDAGQVVPEYMQELARALHQ